MIACPTCGAENPAGKRFCGDCGGALGSRCPACGAESPPGKNFCGECGAALAGPATTAAGPAAERRLVSVLFADLVGFTTLAETRDAEEVRDLLSRYFDTCRRLIGRYGGTVEKFIGDAVMAVWGTPIAREDDAERAVRAALDLAAAVEVLGAELAAPGLGARVGVDTGEAAVTLGAEGQGMVAGDLVNTASRIQSTAAPGTVLVDDATKRAAEAAVAFEDAGAHELKGKSGSTHLWRALRVTARSRGVRHADVLEPPFVGRERELRLVKELFHASAEEGKAHLVSVVGIAGIGKSRLGWEFEKYLDGLLETVWWHRGRCLAYGDGVAYWALAEMVRMRAGIAEDEPAEAARAKLHEALADHIADTDEREWLEPRLEHLLGLTERTAPDREDLYSAWRLFFERLAETLPTVLVFEDLQWADPGLLDFVDYLLDWSRSHSLFVLALTRPELADRRPGWGAATRNSTTLMLEPLSEQAMDQLLEGLVPGLPADLRARILDRAEGVPLYAVETVRMLLDQGLIERQGDSYAVTGPVDSLEVPETLHALLAARLDGLSAEERRVLQDASVLGKSFTKEGVAALSGLDPDDADRVLQSLARKEIVSLQADPRSPERGQYAFLQDLLKRVAYETLARRERRARHLAAAAYLERATGSAEQEAVAVVAAHYIDAYRVAPEDADAPAIKERAASRLAEAGERAAALAASAEAQSYFEQAAALTDDGLARADLHEKAGMAAIEVGPFDDAIPLFAEASRLYRETGELHAAARAAAWQGWATWQAGDLESGSQLLEDALESFADEEPDADLAALAEVRARLRFFLGDVEGASVRVERALEIAEALEIPAVLAEALDTKHLVLSAAGRHEEALALLRHAIEIAERADAWQAFNRALYNLSYNQATRDDFLGAKRTDELSLAHAHRRGDRVAETLTKGHLVYSQLALGEWDEAEQLLAELAVRLSDRNVLDRMNGSTVLLTARGEAEAARRMLDASSAGRTSAEVQYRVAYLWSEALVLRAEGRPAEALAAIQRALTDENRIPPRHPLTKGLLITAGEIAVELGDYENAFSLFGEWDRMQPSDRTPALEAHRERFRAAAADSRGEHDVAEAAYVRSIELFGELHCPFELAKAQIELGALLDRMGRRDEAEPLFADARATFERLRAKPALARLDAVERPRSPA
ncbi:MAG TPA: adenylate/guanylate cyclase domain-containing protein [Gaiellaceae bacterium]|nr:adenylate/guanylate cyclase domain-containing protein [Gaiellaceae bacterium]